MSKSAAEKKGAFAGVGDMMAGGFDDFLTSDATQQSVDIRLDDIAIVEQVRPEDEFEDAEQSLADLGKSLRKDQIQNIVVRPNPALALNPLANVPPYELVVGGRRVRAATVEGLETLRGEIRDLTDDEVESIQLAENIHRKNLSAKSEAKRVQASVDAIGVEATLEKYNKSKSWLSKLLSMLTLPEQANRLVTENVSADPEVINSVKQIEKIDPVAAKAVVEKLKDGKGKVNQREEVKAAKDKVKPPKAKPPTTAPKSVNPENVATSPDLSHQEHGPVSSVPPATLADDPALQELQSQFAAGSEEEEQEHEETPDAAPSLDTGKVPALPPVAALDKVFTEIFEFGSDPKALLAAMPEKERDDVDNWLHSFYDAGVEAVNLASAVLQGFRTGQFTEQGHGAFALVAFLSGGEEGVKFSLLDIFGCIKKA
jgi:ParB family chromosome partitioning protein